MGKRKQSSTVQSVSRALDILEALMASEEVGLVELAQRVELLPSTTHRLLATLVQRGYVFQNPDTGRYLLSYKVLELASHAQRRTSRIRTVARPYLERIRKVSGETTNLVLLDDDHIIYIDQLEGVRAVRMFMEAGRRVPAHTTAAGKALMAFRPEDQVPLLRQGGPFQKFTPQTITRPEDLREELARVRRRGYAIDNEEHEEGVSCVAAAILDHAGTATAAISVSGPTVRLRSIGFSELGELLSSEARDCSAELGYVEASPAGGEHGRRTHPAKRPARGARVAASKAR